MATQITETTAVLVSESVTNGTFVGGTFSLGAGPFTDLTLSAEDDDTSFADFGAVFAETDGGGAQTGTLFDGGGVLVDTGELSLEEVYTISHPVTGDIIKVGRVTLYEDNGGAGTGPMLQEVYIFSGPIDKSATYSVTAINYSPGASGAVEPYGGVSGGGVVCFAAGTLILTETGLVPVEEIPAGTRVQTVDNGLRPVLWHGQRHLRRADMVADPALFPVHIAPGVLGNTRPLLVSRQHRLLLGQRLIKAGHMAEMPGSRARIARGKRRVSYHHLLLDSHQVLLAEGAGAESLYLGPVSCDVLGRGIMGAADLSDLGAGPLARPVLRRKDLKHLSLDAAGAL